MSEPVTEPNMLYEALILLKGFIKFFGFFALFFFALLVGFALLSGMIYIANGSSEPKGTAGGITILNGLLFDLFTFIALCTGKEEALVPRCWHALGVGCVMYGVLLVVELAVVGIIGLCSYCADARRKNQQDSIKLGALAAAV